MGRGGGTWYPLGRAGGFARLELRPEEPPGRGASLKWGYLVCGWEPNVWQWDNVVWAGQSQRWWVLTVRGLSSLGDVGVSWCVWGRTGGVTHCPVTSRKCFSIPLAKGDCLFLIVYSCLLC